MKARLRLTESKEPNEENRSKDEIEAIISILCSNRAGVYDINGRELIDILREILATKDV